MKHLLKPHSGGSTEQSILAEGSSAAEAVHRRKRRLSHPVCCPPCQIINGRPPAHVILVSGHVLAWQAHIARVTAARPKNLRRPFALSCMCTHDKMHVQQDARQGHVCMISTERSPHLYCAHCFVPVSAPPLQPALPRCFCDVRGVWHQDACMRAQAFTGPALLAALGQILGKVPKATNLWILREGQHEMSGRHLVRLSPSESCAHGNLGSMRARF